MVLVVLVLQFLNNEERPGPGGSLVGRHGSLGIDTKSEDHRYFSVLLVHISALNFPGADFLLTVLSPLRVFPIIFILLFSLWGLFAENL